MIKKKSSPIHNDFFQKNFQNMELAVSFFKQYLPRKLVKSVDWNSLLLAPGEFVGKALQYRRSDILYIGSFKSGKILLYIHLEHQRTSVKNMSIRMLTYTDHIWQQFQKLYPNQELPIIYPMVIYQGTRKWTAPLSVHDFMNTPDFLKEYCPQMKYDLMDLSSIEDKDIRGNLQVRLMLLIMKNIDSPHITELLFESYLPLFAELLKDKRGLEHIEDMLYYLSCKGRHLDEDEVIKQLNHNPENTGIKEVIMTLAEQWKQEGIELGIEKGKIEGKIEGKIDIVSRQLKIRFREEACQWTDKLKHLSLDELDIISERILTVQSLTEVFEGFE